MKKLTLVITLIGAMCMALAQDLKFSSPPNTVSVKTLGVRTLGDTGNEWRTGFAFPVMNLKSGRTSGNPVFSTLDVWTLTDAKDFRRLYLGSGLDFPVFERKHMRVGLTGGWTADFSDLEKIKNGRWALGATLTFRF